MSHVPYVQAFASQRQTLATLLHGHVPRRSVQLQETVHAPTLGYMWPHVPFHTSGQAMCAPSLQQAHRQLPCSYLQHMQAPRDHASLTSIQIPHEIHPQSPVPWTRTIHPHPMNNLKLPRGSRPLLAAYSSIGCIQHTRGANAALLHTCLHQDEWPRTCYSQRRPVVTPSTKFPLQQ